jgi:hypothetical protein
MSDQFRQTYSERMGAAAGEVPQAGMSPPLHARARELAVAARNAITNALSTESRLFMQAHAQTSGE